MNTQESKVLFETTIELVGMDGVKVSPHTVLSFLSNTDAYPIDGVIYQQTSGILSLEEYVKQFIAPNDPEYKRINGSYHHTDSQDDFIRRNALLQKRMAELLKMQQINLGETPNGIVKVKAETVVLSLKQINSLRRLSQSPRVVH